MAITDSWIWSGTWPEPEPSGAVSQPAWIVVLGGGDEARVREALRMTASFPDASLLVTGDGGIIQKGLLDGGLDPNRLQVEPAARSTWENATLCSP